MTPEPNQGERPAVIDASEVHDRLRLSEAVAALLDAINGRGLPASGLAVLGSHGFAVYAAIAAALRCGRRVVFLDPSTDLSRMGTILAALDVTTVLDCIGVAPVALPEVAVLDVRARLVDRAPTNPGLAAPMVCEDYAVLTSGTTGEPKVILQTLSNLQAHIANYVGYVGIGPGDRILQLASAGWDAGLMDIFACLFHGGVLCSIDPRVHELAEIRRFITEHGVDVLHMTVPYFRLIHADPTFVYPTRRRLVIGGELIVSRDLERFDRAMPAGSTLFNAYGPTECTTALYNVHRRGESMTETTWPLAFGVQGVEVELAIAGTRARSAHVTGELVVKSTLVARRFDIAAGRAVPLDDDVFGDGIGYYVTGDLAHRDAAGRVVITGRKDSVIKVNGQKVSLYEIETVLRSLEGVSDTCVVVEAGEPDTVVIAAVVLTDTSVDLAGLRRALAQRLPAHKLPKQLLSMNRLPLNKNNKIDRQQIVALAVAERDLTRRTPPVGDGLLADIQRVLRGAPIDPALSFIENGGDSLRALSLVAALKRTGRRISLDQLLSRTPIGMLAVELPCERPAAASPQNTAIASDRGELALPNRAFLESRGIPDLDRWSQTAVFDYTGPRNAADLTQIVRTVLTRHTTTWPGRSPSIRVIEGPPFADEVEAMSRKISLAEGRIIDAAVVADAAGLHVVIACHQFYIDRTSWLIFLAEIAEGARNGAASMLEWQAPDPDRLGWIALYNEHRSAEFSPLWAELPWDRCRDMMPPAPLPLRASFRRIVVELTGAAGRGAMARVDHALLAAALVGLADLTNHSCQKIDILSHGRDVVAGGLDASGIVGWFTVISPFVLDVAVDAPTEVARAVSALRARLAPVAHTFGNEHYRRDTRPPWRCEASYNFIGDLELAGTDELTVNPISIQTMHGAASHPLELTGYRSGSRIQLVIDHDPNAMDVPSITRFASGIERAFSAIEIA